MQRMETKPKVRWNPLMSIFYTLNIWCIHSMSVDVSCPNNNGQAFVCPFLSIISIWYGVTGLKQLIHDMGIDAWRLSRWVSMQANISTSAKPKFWLWGVFLICYRLKLHSPMECQIFKPKQLSSFDAICLTWILMHLLGICCQTEGNNETIK